MTSSAPRLRVVEYADAVAGPVCGRLFAALGHDVVKVEKPGGDEQRRRPPFLIGGAEEASSATFHYLALGKRLRALDLLESDGRRDFEGLLSGADVLVLGVTPAEAAELGLTEERLRVDHPGLTLVYVSAFGLSEAHSDVIGDSLLAEAFGGLVAMVGEPDRAPLSLGGRQAEYSAGVAAFLGACVSLSSRTETAGSVDVAAADVAAYFDWKSEATVRAGGSPPTRTGRGGRWKLIDARDGQVGLIYQPTQWSLVCDLVGDERLRDERFVSQTGRDLHEAEWSAIVSEWMAAHPAAEIARRGQQIGLPLEALSSVSDVVASPQFEARGFLREVALPAIGTVVFPGPPVPTLPWSMAPATELDGLPDGNLTEPTEERWYRQGPPGRPLEGITVLDLGQITAGAALSRLLADFGARVIKVESPKNPDPMRMWGLAAADGSEVSALFAPNNVGKDAITLDLKTVRGRELFLQLAAHCHVVVENFAAGVTDRLGVGFDEVMKVNDRIVYASLSGHGQSGPLARHKSYGSTLDLVSGAASVTGYPGHPVWSSFDLNYPDQLVSLYGAALVVHSLLTRQSGLHLDISQTEVVTSTIGDLVAAYVDSGVEPQPSGNARDYALVHDVFRCLGDDQWVALSITENDQRDVLRDLVGGEGHDLATAVAEWTASRTKDDAAAQLRAAGLPAVAVLTAEDRHAEPRFRRRGVFAAPRDPGVKGLPFVIAPAVDPRPEPAPGVGQDTARVLAEFCEVSPEEYAALAAAGAV